MSNLFDKTTGALSTALQMRQLQQSVTQSNIANADTPHYHAKKLDFENALASALDQGASPMEATHKDHFVMGAQSKPTAEIYDNPDVAVNNDGNSVDLEKEMTALTENSVMYKAALQLINKKMAAVKYAISEGR